MNTRFATSAYRHFLRWGVCTSLAMTVCTIVDALLVGNLVGGDGLAVANIATPVFLIYAMLGQTIGVGANVHIGRLLGSADIDKANAVFRGQLWLGALVGILSLLPLLFRKTYFSLLGVTEELYPLAQQYLTVVMWSAPIFIMYHILSVSVRTDSDPKCAALASSVVILTNLILDIFFMKVLQWGIVGASASLCVAETMGVLVLLTHFLKKHRLLKLGLSPVKPADIKNIVTNGFGVGAANVFGAIVMLAFNTMLLRCYETAGCVYVAVYGVIYTVNTIPAGLFDGASNALSTTTAFLAGEADNIGIFAVLKRALLVVLIAGAALGLLCGVWAEQLLHFFGLKDRGDMATAVAAMRIFATGMVFAGINVVVTVFWQSIGRAKIAAVMSAVRNCVAVLLLGLLLIPQGNIIGLSVAYTGAELFCCVAAFGILLLRPSRKYVDEKYGSESQTFEHDYAIATESAQQIAADIEKICQTWEIGMKQTFFINFVCEELLLNIIKFALADGEKPHYVSIKLIQKEGDIILRIRDDVSCYNPFEAQGDEIDNGVLKLIKNKSKYCDYQRKMIFNYLYVVI